MTGLFLGSDPSAGSRSPCSPPVLGGCWPQPRGGLRNRRSPRLPRPGWRDPGRGSDASKGRGVALRCSWIQSQLLCDRLQGIADELHVLIERYTEDLGAGDELFAVNSAREGLVLHLLAHGAGLDRAQRLVRFDQGASDDEAAHLIDCVERFARVGVARHVQVVGVRGDVLQHVLGPAFLAQHLHSARRMLLRRRAGLVVPVVDQAEHRPALLVLPEAPRVSPHRGLDAAHVPAQLVGPGHGCDELPCFVSGRGSQLKISLRAAISLSCWSRVPTVIRIQPAIGSRSSWRTRIFRSRSEATTLAAGFGGLAKTKFVADGTSSKRRASSALVSWPRFATTSSTTFV